MKICFIGFGNMAKSLVHGLRPHPEYRLWAASPSLFEGINSAGINTHSNNLAIIDEADVIILAVKPSQMKTVWNEIAAQIPNHCLVISIAAGLNLSWFGQEGKAHALVRAMPNIAAAVSQSATALVANNAVSELQKKYAEQIFSTVGVTAWLDNEEEMHICTALSGSGPAYIFLFMEAMIEAAVTLGLPEELSKTLTLQTFQGALQLAKTSHVSLHELRSHVTSPGGTTAAAIKEFQQQDLNKMVYLAIKTACDRSHQLGT